MTKTVGDIKTIRLMYWMVEFHRNCTGDFYPPDEIDLDRMLLHYKNNVCPTESAAAVCEGRELDMAAYPWKGPWEE